MKEIQHVLYLFKEDVYGLFSIVCSNKVGFYILNDLVKILKEQVFSDLEYMGFGHSREFIHFILMPLIVNCPLYLVESISPLFSGYMIGFYNKVLSSWNYNGPPNEKAEFIHDTLARSALLEFVLCIESILFQKKKCTPFFIHLVESTKFVSILEIILNITTKKYYPKVIEVTSNIINSIIQNIPNINMNFRRVILEKIFSIIFDHSIRHIDVIMLISIYNIDQKYILDKISSLNFSVSSGQMKAMKTILSKIPTEKKKQGNVKKLFEQLFSIVDYSHQSIFFMENVVT